MSESFEEVLARLNAERDAKIAAAHRGLDASLKKLRADRNASAQLQPTRGTPNRPSWFSDWMPTPPSWLVGLFGSKSGYTAEKEETTMDGLDCLGAEVIGFDYMNLAKAGTGLLQGYGGMLSDQGSPQAAAQAEKQKQLEEERRKAEKTASNLKLGLGIAGGVLFAAGAAALIARR